MTAAATAAPEDAAPDRPRATFLDQSHQIEDFTASVILPRLAAVCTEHDPAYDDRFGPAFVTWRRAHRQDLIEGESTLRTMQPPAGMTTDEGLAKMLDGAEKTLRAASPKDAARACADMLAEVERKADPGK